MAYITKERVAEIKKELRKEFPKIKFSVTRKDYSNVVVCILEAPVSFTARNYEQLNTYYLNQYQNSDILKRIVEIANKGNYDNSDAMTDYFDCGFYFDLNIGRWDRDFKLTT